MPIKVNISLNSGGRFKPVSSHTLHDKHISVGRDKECTLSLEDTQKHVSRVHAEIDQQDDCYWIKVVSKVNPIAVNGKRHSIGERVPIVEGDQVHIGLYKLEIIEADVAPAPKPRPAPPPSDISEEMTVVRQAKAAPRPPPPSRPAPLIDSEEATFPPAAAAPPAPVAPAAPPPEPPAKSALPESAAEEEEATYVPPVKAPPAAPPPAPAAKAAPAMTSKLPEHEIIDDEVTYIPPMWARQASNRAAGGTPDTTNEDLTGIRRPPTEPAKSAAKAEASQPSEQAASGPELDFDLSDAFDSVPAPVVAKQPPAPQPDVEEDFSEDLTYVRRPPPKPPEAFAPPPPEPTPAPVAKAPAAAPSEPPKPAKDKAPFSSPLAEIQARIAAKSGEAKVKPAPSRPPAGADASVHAFLEAAGLSHLQVDDPEAFMRNSGAMVRAAVGVVLTLLADRAATRKELGAEEEAAGQNPVTSMASPEEVIAFLFDPKRPAIGDTDPAEAFDDACTELRSHQTALVAGMRAAVMTALLRIDPKKIEREHGANLGMLNITRKAKLWDLSVAQHEQLAREVEENFSDLFGREILAAFAEQAKKTGG